MTSGHFFAFALDRRSCDACFCSAYVLRFFGATAQGEQRGIEDKSYAYRQVVTLSLVEKHRKH